MIGTLVALFFLLLVALVLRRAWKKDLEARKRPFDPSENPLVLPPESWEPISALGEEQRILWGNISLAVRAIDSQYRFFYIVDPYEPSPEWFAFEHIKHSAVVQVRVMLDSEAWPYVRDHIEAQSHEEAPPGIGLVRILHIRDSGEECELSLFFKDLENYDAVKRLIAFLKHHATSDFEISYRGSYSVE